MNTTHTPGSLDTMLAGITLDVTALAVRVGAAYAIRDALAVVNPDPEHGHNLLIETWEAVTGLDPEAAEQMVTHILGHHDHVTAAVVPF